MSGTKHGDLSDSLAAMAEAMRQAEQRAREAEQRRREELRRAAHERFVQAAAALQERWQALRDGGHGALVGYALEHLAAQRAAVAKLEAAEIDRARRLAEERDALVSHAVQALQSLGERGRAGALAALPDIGSDNELRAAMAQTMSAGAAVESYLGVLKRARDGLAFLQACETAQVPLGEDVQHARGEVERFLDKPTLAGATRIERVVALLRPAYLEQRLWDQREHVLQVVHSLGEPARQPLLEAWREGFAAVVASLREALARGDWAAAAEPLRELEQFLDARAEARVRMLTRAAREAGFSASEPTRMQSRRGWAASISDKEGLLFTLSEAVPLAQGDNGLDATLVFRGPQDLDGPQCVGLGLTEIAAQLARQGAGLRVFGDGGKELLSVGAGEQAGQQGATGQSAAPGPQAHKAAPAPQAQRAAAPSPVAKRRELKR